MIAKLVRGRAVWFAKWPVEKGRGSEWRLANPAKSAAKL